MLYTNIQLKDKNGRKWISQEIGLPVTLQPYTWHFPHWLLVWPLRVVPQWLIAISIGIRAPYGTWKFGSMWPMDLVFMSTFNDQSISDRLHHKFGHLSGFLRHYLLNCKCHFTEGKSPFCLAPRIRFKINLFMIWWLDFWLAEMHVYISSCDQFYMNSCTQTGIVSTNVFLEFDNRLEIKTLLLPMILKKANQRVIKSTFSKPMELNITLNPF